MTLSLQSSAFSHEGPIPSRYSCDGRNISPPLSWSGVPCGTKSLALIIYDPDAPDPKAPTTVWAHWVLYDIPAEVSGCQEGEVPAGAKIGKNDWQRAEYGGPCPPIGVHRYFHHLYALDSLLANFHVPTKGELSRAMQGHILAEAILIGTYERPGRSIRIRTGDK